MSGTRTSLRIVLSPENDVYTIVTEMRAPPTLCRTASRVDFMFLVWKKKQNMSTIRSKEALERISTIFKKKLLVGRVSILEFILCFILRFFLLLIFPLSASVTGEMKEKGERERAGRSGAFK